VRFSGANGVNSQIGTGLCVSSTQGRFNVVLPVTMRTTPTVLEFSTLSIGNISSSNAITALTFVGSGLENPAIAALTFTVASSLYLANQFVFLNINNSASGFLGIGAEL
jgi:hypothetical protein